MMSKARAIFLGELDSPLGVVFAASTDKGVSDIRIGGERSSFVRNIEDKYDARAAWDSVRFERLGKLLYAYFRGERVEFTLPVDPRGSAFEVRVWEELKAIPYGRTLGYRAVAIRVGSPNGARAIGNACARNPLPVIVPCHRVIASDGTLGGYSGGLDIKRRLLALEGAVFCG